MFMAFQQEASNTDIDSKAYYVHIYKDNTINTNVVS